MKITDILLKCFLVLMLLSVVPCVGQAELGERDHPVHIWRRTADIVDVQEGEKNVSRTHCNEPNVTYIVTEKKCVPNKYFLGECASLSLTPNGEPEEKRLDIKFEHDTVRTISESKGSLITATVVSASNQAHINGTLCHISSLEVYRGKQNSIPIESSGFNISENGTFQIIKGQLGYEFSEYRGELYRMKLSCSDTRLPKSGCFFFKLIGQTNLTEPKFNCTVPGTLQKYTANCPLSGTFDTIYSNTSAQTFTAKPVSTDSPAVETKEKSLQTGFNNGNKKLLLSTVLPIGSIAVGLLLCSLSVCATILICKRKRMKVSAITSREMERRISELSERRISTERRISRERRISTANKLNDMEKQNGCIILSDDELNIYETPDAILTRSNTYGCNCLEDNPAYQKPIAKSTQDAKVDEMLECTYAIIPEIHRAGPRKRSRSGLDTVIAVHNPLYNISLSPKEQAKEYEVPATSNRRPKPPPSAYNDQQ